MRLIELIYGARRRQALTQSEEEDRLAEEEGYDEEEDEDEGQLTMEEYLAKKKASDKLAQLNAKIVQRRPGEGVQLDVGPKDAGDDLEVHFALDRASFPCSFILSLTTPPLGGGCIPLQGGGQLQPRAHVGDDELADCH